VVADELFARTHRVLDAPRPVWVRLWVVFNHHRAPNYQGSTVRQRAYGIDLAAIVAGELLGWYSLDTGGAYWWGLTRFAATSRNGRLHLDLLQLVPAAALSPRAKDEARPPDW
jgi:hypothetical protein